MFKHLFKSDAYKAGFKAAKEGKNELSNPYKDNAMMDNLKKGMGASPWWDTEHKPFIEWDQGWYYARSEQLDQYLNKQ